MVDRTRVVGNSQGPAAASAESWLAALCVELKPAPVSLAWKRWSGSSAGLMAESGQLINCRGGLVKRLRSIVIEKTTPNRPGS
jgi:hypothetical protein